MEKYRKKKKKIYLKICTFGLIATLTVSMILYLLLYNQTENTKFEDIIAYEKNNLQYNKDIIRLEHTTQQIIRNMSITRLLSNRVSVTVNEPNKIIEMDKLHLVLKKHLKELQEPPDCASARYLLCDIHSQSCGFGCLLHRASWCLSHAVVEKRTMVLKPPLMHGYTNKCGNRWDCYFKPVSSCSKWSEHNSLNDATRFSFSSPYSTPTHDFLPSYLKKLETLSEHPHKWFYGHLVGAIFRPNERVLALMPKNIPHVGLHIRRGDKLISEAKKYEVREYIHHIDHLVHPKRHFHTSYDKKYNINVWLATDDTSVLREANNFKQYTFLHEDSDVVTGAHTGNDLDNVIKDLWMMSRAKYFVGTFSSQLGRIVLELFYSQGRHDAMEYVYSLDDSYYYAM